MEKNNEVVLVENKFGNVVEVPYDIAKPMIGRGELVIVTKEEDVVTETKQPKR